ncbi:MAG: trigger factor, partial [Elusimicrobia bacterium]|nr:trigger factor [Elusimicrobiota bacterium]
MGLFSSLEKSDKPKFKKLKEEGCTVQLSIEIPPQMVQDETHNQILRVQQRARVPGFRPGKAPLDLIKNQFAGAAREHALEEMIRRYVPEALRELNLRPVTTPTVEDINWDEGKPVRLQVRVEIVPKVAPQNYAKIQVKRNKYPVSDESVDARLEELREANARLERAAEEAVSAQHYVVIDYTGSQSGKALPHAKGQGELVDMSSEQLLEGLAAGLLGMKREEIKDIPVKIAGKDAVLNVTVKEIKSKVLPALDSEFAKDLGMPSLDELKAKLR